MGYSDTGPLPRTARQFTRELHTALDRANISGPYLIVGHSLAGPTAMVFAHDFAPEVVGMVLVDSTYPGRPGEAQASDQNAPEASPYVDWILPALARIGAIRLVTQMLDQSNDEGKASGPPAVRPRDVETLQNELHGVPASMAQARAAGTFGELPLIVVTAGLNQDPDWTAKQANLLNRSSSSRQIIAEHSGHNIESDQPSIVVDAILDMVEQVAPL